MEALIQPSALKPEGFLGAVVGLCAVVTIVVGVRLWTNYKHLRKLYADDCELIQLSVLFIEAVC